GDGESVLLRRGVDRSPPRSALDAGDALFGVDVDAVECAEVDADTTVDHRRAGHTVAAAVDGERDVLFPGDVDGGGDVVRALAPRDERGVPTDHPVEDAPQLVVRGVAGTDELATEAGELDGAGADVGHACPLLVMPCGGKGHRLFGAAAFRAFSEERLFSPVGTNVVNLHFNVPAPQPRRSSTASEPSTRTSTRGRARRSSTSTPRTSRWASSPCRCRRTATRSSGWRSRARSWLA